NDPCPCGSGRKYKKCCLAKDEEARKYLPAGRLQEIEEQSRLRDKHEQEVKVGLELLINREFARAGRHARRLLASSPEDDRLHDIVATVALAEGDYEAAFLLCRSRWQVATEEKAFLAEHGYHQREGQDRKQIVHFYAPPTWLERLWIAQRARTYTRLFPTQSNAPQAGLVERLKAADDKQRFPARQEEGFELRRTALAPVLAALEAEGQGAIPYLLPLTYTFSWASLFVPDLLRGYDTDVSCRLLAELSMFRYPYFSQKCVVNLESFGNRAVPVIAEVLEENRGFDELKIGLIGVLGNLRAPESFDLLAGWIEHESLYVVNWVAQALGRFADPRAVPYVERAKARLGEHSEIAGAIRDLGGNR
ncbi:MAG: SEC-C domain-containing protein, partial [Rubrivivax sp.]|nr:SEC-C domain-containing protein [Rubrivivax sp.]